MHASNGFANSAAGSAARGSPPDCRDRHRQEQEPCILSYCQGPATAAPAYLYHDLIAVNSPTAELFKFLGRYDIGFWIRFSLLLLGLKDWDDKKIFYYFLMVYFFSVRPLHGRNRQHATHSRLSPLRALVVYQAFAEPDETATILDEKDGATA